MSPLTLTGLDGANPLGFLAALGVLNILAERTDSATLHWRAGDWRPIVQSPDPLDRETLLDALMEDLRGWHADPCLDLRYARAKGGKKSSQAWDLKPPPAEFRAYLGHLLDGAGARNRRSLDFAAAFATETAQDNNGNTKPTALHFTAGQQQFLEMVGRLRDGVTAEDFREAVLGPWGYTRLLPVLGWDCTAARAWALRADDPSKADKRGVPGADWLAFRGLPFIRVAPVGRQIATTGCSGGWKTGQFRWPLWGGPLTRDGVHIVVQLPDLAEMSERERHARGILAIFSSSIRRSDQGGYGGFAPSAAI